MPSVSAECPIMMEAQRLERWVGQVGSIHSTMASVDLARKGRTVVTSPGSFSVGDWQFRTHGNPPGGQESKNSLMCLF